MSNYQRFGKALIKATCKINRQERKDEGVLNGDAGKVEKGSLMQPCPEANAGMTLTRKIAFLFSHWLDFYT